MVRKELDFCSGKSAWLDVRKSFKESMAEISLISLSMSEEKLSISLFSSATLYLIARIESY